MRLPPPITSRTNARVKALRAALSGEARRPGELAAMEGEHLLMEAVETDLSLQTLFVREGSEALLSSTWAKRLQAVEPVVLSQAVFDSAMDTTTPQGVAATFAIPATQAPNPQAPGAVLLLENLQDPGNVGTLIRSAAAFGAAGVLLVGASANPWSPKALRASAGAVLRLPVSKMSLAEAASSLRPDRRFFAAVPAQERAVSSAAADLTRCVLMIGNEGRGLTREALAIADERITIPCRIESFNAAVAGSVLLYECFRQSNDAVQPGPAERPAAEAV